MAERIQYKYYKAKLWLIKIEQKVMQGENLIHCLLFLYWKSKWGLTKNAKFVRMLAPKPEDPSSTFLALLGKEKTDSHKLSSYLYTQPLAQKPDSLTNKEISTLFILCM